MIFLSYTMNIKDTSIFQTIKRNEPYIDFFMFFILNVAAIIAIFNLQKIDNHCFIQIGKELLNCYHG
jgi:hypothetical protein